MRALALMRRSIVCPLATTGTIKLMEYHQNIITHSCKIDANDRAENAGHARGRTWDAHPPENFRLISRCRSKFSAPAERNAMVDGWIIVGAVHCRIYQGSTPPGKCAHVEIEEKRGQAGKPERLAEGNNNNSSWNEKTDTLTMLSRLCTTDPEVFTEEASRPPRSGSLREKFCNYKLCAIHL